jgi:hypothetical protein
VKKWQWTYPEIPQLRSLFPTSWLAWTLYLIGLGITLQQLSDLLDKANGSSSS